MKLLEVFKNESGKFFARNTICRTVKGGYAYIDERKIWIPSETKLTIEYFDLYANKVHVMVDGRQQVQVTYEYLMDCVIPINVDVAQVVTAVQILQRVNHVLSNETLIKLVCVAMSFAIGVLAGKVL